MAYTDNGRQRMINNHSRDYQEGSDDVVVFSAERTRPRLSDVTTELGYGGWRPQWLQRYNTSKFALALLCLSTAVQSFIVNGCIPTNLPMLERRYNLDSAQASFIVSIYDIIAAVLVLPIGFFGHDWHKPRVMAFGTMVTGLGSLLMALPHFISGKYELGQSFLDLCDAHPETECARSTGLHSYALYIFLLAQSLHAVGGVLLYTLAFVYIDENVKTHTSPLYIGIFGLAGVVGPALGFVGGGQLLSVYVDVDKIGSAATAVTTDDPRWVGAWWICFIIGAISSFVCGAMMFCLGKEIPGASEIRKKKATEEEGTDVLSHQGSIKFRDLPKSTMILVKNPTFMLVVFAFTLNVVSVHGMASFLPKFIANQFNMEPARAAMLTGLIVVPSAGAAGVIGGLLPEKLKLQVRGMLRLAIVCLGMGILTMPILLTMCELPKMPGTLASYSSVVTNVSSTHHDLISSCNSRCNCTTLFREPVCGVDNREYFSPCHAGCDTFTQVDKKHKVYGNCSCITDYLGDRLNSTGNSTQWDKMATSGRCPVSCGLQPLFFIVLLILIFLVFIPVTPTISTILRCTPYRQRSYAIAVKGLTVRVLGSVPGPVIFGLVIDSACLKWQRKCGDRGACWIYDNRLLGVRIFGVSTAVCLGSLFLYICSVLVYKAPPYKAIESEDRNRRLDDATDRDMDARVPMMQFESSTAAL